MLQKISKLNPTTHQKEHTEWTKCIHSRVTRMVQHVQNQCDIPHQQKKWPKSYNYINAEKAFDKIQHPSIKKKKKTKKNSPQSGYIGNISQQNNSHLWQTYCQHSAQEWRVESLPAKFWSTTRTPTFTICSQHSTRSPSHSNEKK